MVLTASPALLLAVALLLLPAEALRLRGISALLLAVTLLLRLGLLGRGVILLRLLRLPESALVIATLRWRWLAIRVGGLVVGCLPGLVVSSTVSTLLLLLLPLPLLAVTTLVVPLLATWHGGRDNQ